ncbi:MAG: hypothetical protein ABIL40_07315 [candidate division WOR-3 bacterium]
MRTGLLEVVATFRVRNTLRFKNIYPQAKACAYHFTGYSLGLAFFIYARRKPCPTKVPNAKSLITLTNLAHEFHRPFIKI